METTSQTLPTGGHLWIDDIELLASSPAGPIAQTPLIIHKPANQAYFTGRNIAVSGTCNAASGSLLVALGYDIVTTPCGLNDKFSTTVTFTGNSGNIALAVKPV